MAHPGFTSWLRRRGALFLFLAALPALLSAIGADAQTPARPANSLDDRFFHPSAYSNMPDETSQYADLPVVDDKYLPPQYEGRSLNRAEFAKVVLEHFIRLAAERGIPERGITRALFDGRLNPDFEDLTLAYEGLGKPEQIPPEVIARLKQSGRMKPNETTPPARYLTDVYAQHRNKLWNQRFGSIADIGTVDTIVYGREVRRSANDILLRLYMRLWGFPADFLPRDFNLTYDQVHARYQQHAPDKLAAFDESLRRLAESYSAYSYF
nr:hypothetical protein [Acidobacteriota bacterium]